MSEIVYNCGLLQLLAVGALDERLGVEKFGNLTSFGCGTVDELDSSLVHYSISPGIADLVNRLFLSFPAMWNRNHNPNHNNDIDEKSNEITKVTMHLHYHDKKEGFTHTADYRRINDNLIKILSPVINLKALVYFPVRIDVKFRLPLQFEPPKLIICSLLCDIPQRDKLLSEQALQNRLIPHYLYDNCDNSLNCSSIVDGTSEMWDTAVERIKFKIPTDKPITAMYITCPIADIIDMKLIIYDESHKEPLLQNSCNRPLLHYLNDCYGLESFDKTLVPVCLPLFGLSTFPYLYVDRVKPLQHLELPKLFIRHGTSRTLDQKTFNNTQMLVRPAVMFQSTIQQLEFPITNVKLVNFSLSCFKFVIQLIDKTTKLPITSPLKNIIKEAKLKLQSNCVEHLTLENHLLHDEQYVKESNAMSFTFQPPPPFTPYPADFWQLTIPELVGNANQTLNLNRVDDVEIVIELEQSYKQIIPNIEIQCTAMVNQFINYTNGSSTPRFAITKTKAKQL